jgi:hypothetical protein
MSRLPGALRRQLGLESVLAYVGDRRPEGEADFRVRIVHHELRSGLFPALDRPEIGSIAAPIKPTGRA